MTTEAYPTTPEESTDSLGLTPQLHRIRALAWRNGRRRDWFPGPYHPLVLDEIERHGPHWLTARFVDRLERRRR